MVLRRLGDALRGRSLGDPGLVAGRDNLTWRGDGAPDEEAGMKFLVVWKMEISRLSAEMMKTVLRMPDYAKPLEESGKVVCRYHIVGYHGGAWIFDVESNDELEMLLAQAPVYNFSHFDVYPLADMSSLPVVPPEQ